MKLIELYDKVKALVDEEKQHQQREYAQVVVLGPDDTPFDIEEDLVYDEELEAFTIQPVFGPLPGRQ